MLTVFLGGSGTFRNGTGRIRVEAGMVGLVRMEDGGVLFSDETNPYHHYYCRFGGEYAMHLAACILEEYGNFFRFDQAGEVADRLKRMGRIHRRQLPETMGMRELLLADALLILSGGEHEDSRPHLSHASLSEYFDTHLAEPTDLDRMAEVFGVSKSTLCRAARKHLGTTIQNEHERIKLDWAATLLKSNAFSVADVAARTGFRNPLYFSRVFRRRFGLPPSMWRGGQRMEPNSTGALKNPNLRQGK
jgi:AraC-like DNA-binding protein